MDLSSKSPVNEDRGWDLGSDSSVDWWAEPRAKDGCSLKAPSTPPHLGLESQLDWYLEGKKGRRNQEDLPVVAPGQEQERQERGRARGTQCL